MLVRWLVSLLGWQNRVCHCESLRGLWALQVVLILFLPTLPFTGCPSFFLVFIWLLLCCLLSYLFCFSLQFPLQPSLLLVHEMSLHCSLQSLYSLCSLCSSLCSLYRFSVSTVFSALFVSFFAESFASTLVEALVECSSESVTELLVSLFANLVHSCVWP